jgi:FAD/FMN-containing dehydrogenase
MQWVRDTIAALEPYTAPRTYMNYAADDEADRIAAFHGPNLDRLRDIKRRYDPDNVFRVNQNIPPA